MTWRRLALAAAVGSAFFATPAAAHIQVRPTEAAPLDPTLWTLLVPNERKAATTKVELKVPNGVVPFSFEATPGWRRSVTYAADKSLDTVVWEGRVDGQGLVRFTFLATTPQREQTLEWKALQTYADGNVVRWIGPEGSEEPASFTRVSRSVPRENAGGEGQGGGAQRSVSSSVPTPAASDGDDGGGDALGVALAGAALAVSLAALGVALTARRRRARLS